MEDWKDTLKQAIDVDSTHISVYDLQIEEKTAFGRWYSPGIYPLPTEDVATNMYSTAVETLTNARFEHYEVSNYAKEGKRSRHNQKYWSCSDVLAFGKSCNILCAIRDSISDQISDSTHSYNMLFLFYSFYTGNGAASLVDGKRQIRPRTMAQYSDWLKKDRSAKEFILETTEVDLLERVMLALRTADGLNLEYITENYGEDTCRVIESVLTPYISSGHVRLNPSSINSKNIGLTDPLGFLLSNTIISDVFAVLS
jgi:oxygen-independent coproporphyrinogen-3 oxidase